jgi:hypothetical protein
MGNIPHLLAEVEGSGALLAAGHISLNGTTATMTQLSSPQFFIGDMTLNRVSAGIYRVTLTNFRGPVGIVFPFVTAGSTATTTPTTNPGLPVSVSLNSYTSGTDTYSFTVGVNSGASYVDADVYWMALGF